MNMKYFEYGHLPEKLQEVSRPIGELANLMNSTLAEGSEKSTGLRKLLEAKDCFVRAALDAPTAFPKKEVEIKPRELFQFVFDSFELFKNIGDTDSTARCMVQLISHPSVAIGFSTKIVETSSERPIDQLREAILEDEVTVLKSLMEKDANS